MRGGVQLVGDLHQLGDRRDPHLLHHVRTVRLDRALGGAEIGGNLLVELAGDDAGEDLALARRERLVAGAQRTQPFPGRPRLRIARERGPHRSEQRIAADRLREEVDRPGFHRAHAHRDVAVPGEEDDRQPHLQLRERLLQVEAARAGHPDVEHDATGSVPVPAAEQEFARGCVAAGLEAGRLQQAHDPGPHRVVVVDDVDDRAVLGHDGSVGTVNRNVAPPPERFSAQIRPPCASTIERASGSPRPIPSFFVV